MPPRLPGSPTCLTHPNLTCSTAYNKRGCRCDNCKEWIRAKVRKPRTKALNKQSRLRRLADPEYHARERDRINAYRRESVRVRIYLRAEQKAMKDLKKLHPKQYRALVEKRLAELEGMEYLGTTIVEEHARVVVGFPDKKKSLSV